MGTYYNGKITVVGEGPKLAAEKGSIEQAIIREDYLCEGLNRWTGSWKNWWPDDLLRKISKACDKTYIRLQVVQEGTDGCPYFDTIFYKGESINGEHKNLKRNSPLSAVQRAAREIRKGRRSKGNGA